MNIEIGDKLIFVGNDNPLTDFYTKRLIYEFLKIGNIYTVLKIMPPMSYLEWKEIHYLFSEPSTSNYWFPSSCFKYVSSGIGIKYDLR